MIYFYKYVKAFRHILKDLGHMYYVSNISMKTKY